MSNTLANNLPSDDEDPLPSSSRQSEINIETIVDSSVAYAVDLVRIETAIFATLSFGGFTYGSFGVRITDDSTIRSINAKHLDHDYATDVISFAYQCCPPAIEGELVVSVETAQRIAAEIRKSSDSSWSTENELMLYIIHGTLHCMGMDDLSDGPRQAMRESETEIMLSLGIDAITRCGADSFATNSSTTESPQ